MSIATEISRLQTAKANIKTSIENKGVTVSSSATLDEYPSLIDSISSGSANLQQKTATPSYSSVIVSPDNGYDGLSQVTVNPIVLRPGFLRPDAELVKTYSYDRYIVADEEVTLPVYADTSSAAVVLKASETLSDTYTCSLADYYYFITIETLTIPEYSISTVEKGRFEYFMSSVLYELATVPKNTIHALIDPDKYYTHNPTPTVTGTSSYRGVYWTNTTTLGLVTSTSYGTTQVTTAPTFTSSGTYITVKTPRFDIRGHQTYFSSTYFNSVTDIRFQWIIRIYRVPQSTRYGIDGWGFTSQLSYISSCLDNNTHTLE